VHSHQGEQTLAKNTNRTSRIKREYEYFGSEVLTAVTVESMGF
jgi:hypothetical protein